MPTPITKARFVEPMLLLRSETLPEGEGWAYELKLDGYRAVGFKTGGKVHLRSRNDNDFTARYSAGLRALAAMPDAVALSYRKREFKEESMHLRKAQLMAGLLTAMIACDQKQWKPNQ